MTLGCACKVYSIRTRDLSRTPRFDTPLSRIQAELFRRRAPPPPYHEAMLTSRPYDEAVREYLSHATPATFSPSVMEHNARHSRLNAGYVTDSDADASNENPRQTEDPSLQSLIDLMDVSEESSISTEDNSLLITGNLGNRDHQAFTDPSQLDNSNVDTSNLFREQPAIDDLFDGTSETFSRRFLPHYARANSSLEAENCSEDSASAILFCDGLESSPLADKTKTVEKPIVDSDSQKEPEMESEKDEGKLERKDSDTDSVCILCLDDPVCDLNDSDTRCLLEEY